MILPGVSILVPTYGRTKLLAEVIQCFVKQTYEGPKELIILNDRADQVLRCAADNVKIMNLETRFSNLGKKRNSLINSARYNLICYWDDDDIFLPERISRAVALHMKRSKEGRRVSKERRCFAINSDGTCLVRDSGYLWCAIFDKGALLEIGGFNDINMGEDVDIIHRMIKKNWLHGEVETPGMPSFIYRLHGTSYAHMVESGEECVLKADDVDNKIALANERVHKFITDATEKKIADGDEPTGRIFLEPKWNNDYLKIAEAAWDISPKNPNRRT